MQHKPLLSSRCTRSTLLLLLLLCSAAGLLSLCRSLQAVQRTCLWKHNTDLNRDAVFSLSRKLHAPCAALVLL